MTNQNTDVEIETDLPSFFSSFLSSFLSFHFIFLHKVTNYWQKHTLWLDELSEIEETNIAGYAVKKFL